MSWLLDAFELFMLNVSCNSHCFLALCCALHRITSRVIHRTELYFLFLYIYIRFIFNDKQQWFVEWKGLKQAVIILHIKDMKNILWLVIYIMVRHNHMWWLCEVKSFLLMIVLNQSKTINGNDPYAGSPTNTLLRLLLPLNDPVWASFRYKPNDPKAARKTKPKISLKHSIGSSDGRCVQRTGT